MRLYFYGFVMFVRRYVLRQDAGTAICWFAERMGVVYIKLAQILAMQNIGEHFTESDRRRLSRICDQCNPIEFSEIQAVLEREYGCDYAEIFQSIDPEPLGSASISQVHRAVLKDGRVVAVKVKREDITRKVAHDVRQARRLVRRFGRFASFRNFLGSDRALELYMQWIVEETDFAHERSNLLRYHEFAASVNGNIEGAVNICAPKLYPELCTDNIIVMEFIATPTANRLTPSAENNQRLSTAVNDYVRLSFYALLHGLPVVFHGDPHSGNIYLDEQGNVGFLDFGLIFEFDSNEAEFIRQLFLSAYSKKTDKIIEMVVSRSNHTDFDREQLAFDIQAKVDRFHDIPVTQFFIEMIGVFTQYNIAPPEILFKMAKSFLALFGINNFIRNSMDTETLLARQVTEFYLETLWKDLHRQVLSTAQGFHEIFEFWQKLSLNASDQVTELLARLLQ